MMWAGIQQAKLRAICGTNHDHRFIKEKLGMFNPVPLTLNTKVDAKTKNITKPVDGPTAVFIFYCWNNR
jgi:hypothetical protein